MDLDAFFTSVEEILAPELKGKPLVVGGNADERGVVASASYAARRFGVRSAMPMKIAMELCPKLVVRPPQRHVYRAYSNRVMDLMREYSSQVETVSIDEAYVEFDSSTPFHRVGALAQEIKNRVKQELGLACSVGIATNKLVAKIACDVSKPDGFLLVREGEEATFLAPLPIRRIPGVGPRTELTLSRWNIVSIGDLALFPGSILVEIFGKRGAVMYSQARGIDVTPVLTHKEAKSRSVEETFPRDVSDLTVLLGTLRKMSRGIAKGLMKEVLSGRTIGIKLRYADFTTLTRAYTRPHATSDEAAIYADAAALLQNAWDSNKPIRLLGLRVGGFLVAPSSADSRGKLF